MEFLSHLFGVQTAFAQNAGEIATETEGQLTQLVGQIISQIPLWITAFIVLVITFVIARIAKSAVENKMAAEGFEEENKEMAILASRSVNIGVLVVGITVALKIAGIDLTSIIAAGAFGIGFALKDIIMNFIAGVMILSSRHYSIGDSIKVGATVGKIVEIQTRATILKAFDGTKIIVPNSTLFKKQVTSLTSNPFRRIKVAMGVGYDADLKKTMEVVLAAVEATEGVLAQPKPGMRYTGFGAYSIEFGVKAWVASRGGWIKIRHRMVMNIRKALHEAGIEIPYPIQTLHVSEEEEQEEKVVMDGGESAPQKMQPVPVTVENQAPPKPISTEDINAQTWLKKTPAQPTPPPEPQPAPAPEQPAQPEQKPIAGITPVQPPQPAPAPEQQPQQPQNPDQQGQ